jgi:hypothetical protein
MFSNLDIDKEKLQTWFGSKEPKYCGAIGGRFTYMMTPTSLGTVCKVRDNLDGDEIDVTDYDMW